MKTQYFVQYSDISIINDYALPKDMFKSVDVGIRKIETDFLFTLVQNIFGLSVFFVLESVIFKHNEKTISENNIPYYKFASEGMIINIDSVDTLEMICNITVDLVLNGLNVFIFFGQGLSEENLVPSRNWDKPIEFKHLDFEKVDTFIDVYEVGLTIFSKNDKFCSPRKVAHCISKAYSLDVENSDI
ncbi:hypothetical protein KUV80_04905 [Fictibacillus nanhaiensis]|uniref:hypothetical protein n=1 Tax=Fictibacillus nanhaiensis TaxID=742169 RepID=UPI001C95E057|nr:hypothetical protein [Fictibacillus nanhaiensis]MBY6035975.1 hypothetical protein [Fictibacillus nanhaiensis]